MADDSVITTKKEAIKSGLSKYFTGMPCKSGHTAHRWVKNSHCIECDKINRKKRRLAKKIEPEAPKIISREDARAAGLTKFFTAMPCFRGHVAQQFVNNGACVECRKVTTAARKNRFKRPKNLWNDWKLIKESCLPPINTIMDAIFAPDRSRFDEVYVIED